jgi:hypothetical protein
VIVLSKITGWGLAEIMGLDIDEFWLWLEHGQMVENEIAERVRQG